eukprot:10319083-Heterocapsa_arctica.AAC.1
MSLFACGSSGCGRNVPMLQKTPIVTARMTVLLKALPARSAIMGSLGCSKLLSISTTGKPCRRSAS